MAGHAVSPAYPVPKYQTTVSFSLTETGTDFIRVWCTVAPTGSEFDNRINSNHDPRNRIVAFEGSVATAWNYTFDKGGKYTFIAQEYLKGSGYGGGYQGDPNTADKETKVGVETTLEVFVGQRMTQPIGPAGNQATLVLWVWNHHIRATTKAFHGEDSPSITATAPSPAVKTAMGSASVDAALAALVGADLDNVNTVGDFSTWTSNIFEAINSHVDSSPAHDGGPDTYNVLLGSYSDTPDQKAFIAFVNQALKSVRQHVTNDLGIANPPLAPVGPAPYGPDSGNYHYKSAKYVSDRTHVPLYDGVSTYADAYGALADVSRCVDGHQRANAFHDSSYAAMIGIGNMTAVIALPKIQQVHSAYLAVLASADPSAPPAQSDGAQTLITAAGFVEAPL